MSLKLADVVQANQLLVALGGEDQMQRIAAASIERAIELQNRIDRALNYADQTPPNSAHARNIARILDGSITVDDELNEVDEIDRPINRLALHEAPAQRSAPPAKRTRGPGKKPKTGPGSRGSALAGRPKPERAEFRKWAAEQGYVLPKAGPIRQEFLDMWDEYKEALRLARKSGQLPM
jgi:hypothetical protein